jgi:hypothetical protein
LLELLRDKIQGYLERNTVGVLTVAGKDGVSAMPVKFQNRELDVECLVPRWADIAYHLETNPHVMLLILLKPPSSGESLCWLQYSGTASFVFRQHPASVTDPHLTVLLTPERIDLVDERRGWGVRETLENIGTLTDP